jgi:DNA-binding Lrp family transcriptional regulator
MITEPDALCPCGKGLDRCRLVARLQEGLPLSDRPFAEIGRDCGLTEDEVLGRLQRMLAHGVLGHLGPLRVDGEAPMPPAAPDGLAARLLASTESGLPLVARPYEALAAMLGVQAPAVREQLQRLIDGGQLAQIGVRLGDTARRV